MAWRQSVGFVTSCISGGTSQPGGVVSPPHSIGQYPIEGLVSVGIEMLVLRWRSGIPRKSVLAAREVKRRAESGVLGSIMR